MKISKCILAAILSIASLISTHAAVAAPGNVIHLKPASGSTIATGTVIQLSTDTLFPKLVPEDPKDVTKVAFYLGNPSSSKSTLLANRPFAPFYFKVDSKLFPEGQATIVAVATNGYGGKTYTSATYQVDKSNQVPTVTFYPRPETTRVLQGTSAYIGFRVSDPEKLKTVQLHVDGVRTHEATQLPVYHFELDTTKFADGQHYLSLTAIDSDGASKVDTILVEFQNNIDRTPPFLELTSHKSGQTIKGNVRFEVNAFDETGVNRVEFSFGGQILPTVSTAPYAAEVNTFQYANAVYELLVKVVDATGLETQQTYAFSVLNNANNSEAATFLISSPQQNAVVGATATLTVFANSSLALKNVDLVLDGAKLFSFTLPPYTYILDTRNLKDGRHTLRAIGFDFTGNYMDDFLDFTVSNNDPSAVNTSFGTAEVNYMDNIKATSEVLKRQVAALKSTGTESTKKATAAAQAVKGTLDTLSKLVKKHTKDLKAEYATSKIPALIKNAQKISKNFLSAGKTEDYSKGSKALKPLFDKISKATL